MLIDDIYGNQNEDAWVALDAHENTEVRLWNPWKRSPGRLIQSVLRVREIDYRMHAKSSKGRTGYRSFRSNRDSTVNPDTIPTEPTPHRDV